MKPLVGFIKANPIALLAAFVAIGSVAWLYLIFDDGGSFKKEMTGSTGDIAALDALKKTGASLPSPKPDAPPKSVTIPVNEKAIKTIEEVYAKMNDEYRKIFERAVEVNKGNHVPMDDGLFPEPKRGATHKLFYAKRVYRQYFERIMNEYSPDVQIEPRLHAGMPPAADDIKIELESVEQNYLRGFFPIKQPGELTGDEKKILHGMKKKRLLDLLQRRAREIHVYAITDFEDANFPFQVDAWSEAGNTKPLIEEIWDSQMSLWIQQDIARVIMATNEVDNPAANVTNRPIKRLLAISPVPGYVGINSEGGMAQVLAKGEGGGKASSRFLSGGGGGAGGGGGKAGGVIGIDKVAAPSLGDPDAKLPDNFGIAPTGRVTNPLYDVRHVWIHMVVDFKQLPVFFNSLSDSNFMSVLYVRSTDIDEYEHLKSGFVYGNGDCVEVEILVETIWLRDWTSKYMPPKVRTALGVKDVEAGE